MNRTHIRIPQVALSVFILMTGIGAETIKTHPFGIHLGGAFGGGCKAGGEYRLTGRLSVNPEAVFRYLRALVKFRPDYHLWENTENYQDIHTEILPERNEEIADEAELTVVPSMSGCSIGLSLYL